MPGLPSIPLVILGKSLHLNGLQLLHPQTWNNSYFTQSTQSHLPTSPRGAAVINTDHVGGGRASWYCEEKLLDELIAGLAFIALKERRAAGKRAVGALCRIAAVVCR